MQLIDIKTKMLSSIEDDDNEVEVSFKVNVKNDSDGEISYINIQGIDKEGFEVFSLFFDKLIKENQERVMTTREYINKDILDSIVKWQMDD